MKNYDDVIKAVDEMFSNTRVSVGETSSNLQSIIEHCETLLESLDLEEEE